MKTPDSARKPYHSELTRWWWLKQRYYRLYMLREATVLPLLFSWLPAVWPVQPATGRGAVAGLLPVYATRLGNSTEYTGAGRQPVPCENLFCAVSPGYAAGTGCTDGCRAMAGDLSGLG